MQFLVCVKPRLGDFTVCQKLYFHFAGVFHFFGYYLQRFFCFIFRRFHNQFIVHLKNKTGLHIFIFKAFVHLNHGDFDNISRRTLNRHISCNTLTECTQHMIAYMWFLTHSGIDRYNGKEFKRYKLTDGNKKITSMINLNWLYVDNQGDDQYLDSLRKEMGERPVFKEIEMKNEAGCYKVVTDWFVVETAPTADPFWERSLKITTLACEKEFPGEIRIQNYGNPPYEATRGLFSIKVISQ